MTSDKTVQASLRSLPSVEKLVSSEPLQHLPRVAAVRAAREVLNDARAAILQSPGASFPLDFDTLLQRTLEVVRQNERPTLRRAINATGVLLHTNLGRATLAKAAAEAVAQIGAGHASLEVDEETGGRGFRQNHVTSLLCELTGAEDALVVNNNAAATFLAVAAMAQGREVILSRGQLVEIGGQFRLPDVIESTGARLVEVGTTNRTRLNDYERAITDRTALLLRVHPSNYRIVGFTEDVDIADLVELGANRSLPVGDDIGSGSLVDFAPYGLTEEPMAQRSIACGADVVWFSGDKLLGGPQAGILIGKTRYLSGMKSHPLARALRPDKLTLAALEATLRIYRSGDPWKEIPILRRIARPAAEILTACGRVARGLREAAPQWIFDISATQSQVGGGSLPGGSLASWAIAVEGDGVEGLARNLRRAEIPVYGRIEKGRLLLDLRAVDEEEEALLITAFRERLLH